MLVISRNSGEKIRLSNGITISIEGLTPSRVRVGIDAPIHIKIVRSSPCVVCHAPCFDYYLGYHDIPFCGKPECQERIRKDNAHRLDRQVMKPK